MNAFDHVMATRTRQKASGVPSIDGFHLVLLSHADAEELRAELAQRCTVPTDKTLRQTYPGATVLMNSVEQLGWKVLGVMFGDCVVCEMGEELPRAKYLS